MQPLLIENKNNPMLTHLDIHDSIDSIEESSISKKPTRISLLTPSNVQSSKLKKNEIILSDNSVKGKVSEIKDKASLNRLSNDLFDINVLKKFPHTQYGRMLRRKKIWTS